jgi:hypothetical protein
MWQMSRVNVKNRTRRARNGLIGHGTIQPWPSFLLAENASAVVQYTLFEFTERSMGQGRVR